MLTKLATFRGVSDQGEPLIHLFDPGVSMVKQAGEMMPVIKNWLDAYRPDPNKIAVLVNALGSSEYWGQNVNGDVFPESSLVHDCANHPGKQHPYDDFTGKNIPPYGAHTFMQAHPFVHHCFPAGTKVVMGDRDRMVVEDVREGDLVATRDGPREVSKVMRRSHEGGGVRIRLKGEFERLTVTDGHPLLTYRRSQIHCEHRYSRITNSKHHQWCKSFKEPIGAPEWVKANEVMPGDYLVTPKPSCGGQRQNPNFARLVGWVASEGYLGKKGIIQFSFSESNTQDIDSVKECLNANGLHVSVTPRPEQGIIMLTSCNKELHRQLSKYIQGVKSEKEILGCILEWNMDSLFLMLGAYIDGDGHVPSTGRNKGQLRIRSSSKKMLRILSDIVRALSVPATVCWDRKPGWMLSPTNGEYYWTEGSGCVTVQSSSAQILCVHSRKIFFKEGAQPNIFDKLHDNHFLTQVTEVDDLFLQEDVYNLEVEGNHEYVAGEVVVHNCNKDPNRAFGKVVLWAWNPKMHRVELIILLDKSLALQHGAQHVIDRILAGEFPDVSMGCKVPYDICTICGHKSKTRKDYCNCIRFIGMNKVLDDGRCIGVVNTYPRFFDISFVFIGADKTAKVMCKLASGLWVPQSVLDAEELYGTSEDDGQLVKAASVQVPDNLVKISGPLQSSSWFGNERKELLRRELEDQLQKELPKSVKPPKLKTQTGILGFLGSDVVSKTLKTRKGKSVLQKGEPLGASLRKAPFLKKWYLEADSLYLKPEYQKHGIGSSAVKAITTAAKNLGADSVTLQAEDAGKVVWSRVPGARFQKDSQKEIYPEYKKWRKKHGGPDLKKDALPNEYPKEFLRVAEPNVPGFIGYEIPVNPGQKHPVDPVPLGVAAGGLLLGIGAVAAKKFLKTGALEKTAALSRGEIMDFYTKRAERLMTSRTDPQDNLERRAIADGALKTNADVNETDEFPEPLMPSRGKTASSLKQFILESREKTAELAATPFKEKKAADGMSGLWAKCKKMKIGPPPKPNRKEYPFTGTIDFKGLMIHVENKPGSVREGKGWRTNMRMAYGEFLGTRGVDKDKLDVYVGPYRNAPNVIIIHQNFVRGPKKGKYDEDKVMVGFQDLEQAKAAYLAHYDSDNYFRSATVMAFPLFKRAIMKKEVHGEKVASVEQSEYVAIMEKRAEDLRLEDLFAGAETARRRSKVWRHSDGRELKRTGSGMDDWGQVKQASVEKDAGFWDIFSSKKKKPSASATLYPRDELGNRIRSAFTEGPDSEEVPGMKMYRAYEKAGGTDDIEKGEKVLLQHPEVKKMEKRFGVKFKGFSTGNSEGDWKFNYEKVAEVEKYAALNPQDLLKVSAEKWADIVKHIGPGKAVGKVSPLLSDTEPSLPREMLNGMSSKGMESALSTPSMMGMVLKPEEFQRICLNCMGKGDLADKMDDAGATFTPSEGEEAPCQELNSDQLDPELMKSLMPSMGEKSYLGPIVRRRIIRITIMPPEPMTKPTEVNSPLLSKVASAYNWYRREQMKLAADTMEVVPNNPELHSGLYGIGDEDLFGKTAASTGVDRNTLAVVLGSIPITLMYSAHLRGERIKGEDLGMLKNLVADHPWLATMGTAAGLRELMKSPKAKQLVSEVVGAGKRIMKGAPAPAAA